MNPSVFIIILNWNGGKDTVECLDSVYKIDYDNIKVVLVDNGSLDGVIALVKEKYKENIVIIENKQNLGFVEGNNIGIKYAISNKAEYIFLLNNDTVVNSDILKEMFKVFTKDERIAVVAPKILNYYFENTIESAGGRYSINRGRNIAIGYGQADKGQYDFDYEVDFVSGCAFFVKSEVFKRVGLFDKKYFAYYEDMDLCHRLKKAGYKFYYAYKAKIWHKVSAATGGYKNPNSIFWSTRNRFIFVFNCGLSIQKVFFIIYFFLIYSPSFLFLNLCKWDLEKIKAFFIGVTSAIFGRMHYSKDFPSHISLDLSSISKSKAGVGYYTSELMKGLSKANTKNYFSFFNYPDFLNFKIFNIVLRLIWEQLILPLWFLVRHPDLVHFPAFVCPIFKTTKMVVTIHDMAYLLYPEMFVRVYRLYLKIFVPLSAKRADIIFADSENTKQDIVKLLGVSPKKIEVVYPGINSFYRVLSDQKQTEETLKKYLITKPYLLSVGTLEPRKNIKGLIKAFAVLCKEKDFSYTLVVVGGRGWFYDNLFKEVEDLNIKDRIIFTGYVTEEEMLHLYNRAEIFVYPSFYEGFGLPPLESMACGLPVITSNTSSLPEVVGDAGLLVDPYNIQDIADKIKNLLKDKELQKMLRIKGLERVKKFVWENTVNQTIKCYENLIDSK